MMMPLPLCEELNLPLQTALDRLAGAPHRLLLDSAEAHPQRGRTSYLTADPVRFVSLTGEDADDPFATLRAGLPRLPHREDLPPFQGGWAGLFGYELGGRIERLPRCRFDEFRLPTLAVGLYDWVLAHDHHQGRTWLVSTGITPSGVDPDFAAERLRQVRARLLHAAPTDASHASAPVDALPLEALCPQHPLAGHPGVTSNFSRAGFEAAVRRAVEYIHAGDCFQVNLAQRLLAPLREEPLALYRRLRVCNPAPFAGYFEMGGYTLLSASPERFLSVSPAGVVETRPIKGTRPRGHTPEEDARQIRDLLTSPKDRAENVMIVDLLRNDLGRVCRYGSVQVPRVCELETFRHVHHMVSEVRGVLRHECDPLALLRASFPGGSVTGAPKVRAMEVITELEPTARGAYCGSMGFVGASGAMDTNILIRTLVAGRGWVHFPVGGGIVADSQPAREYEETLHKARGLLQALRAD